MRLNNPDNLNEYRNILQKLNHLTVAEMTETEAEQDEEDQ